jgi:hypothetical protein
MAIESYLGLRIFAWRLPIDPYPIKSPSDIVAFLYYSTCATSHHWQHVSTTLEKRH